MAVANSGIAIDVDRQRGRRLDGRRFALLGFTEGLEAHPENSSAPRPHGKDMVFAERALLGFLYLLVPFLERTGQERQ